jgi:hypothetical protein
MTVTLGSELCEVPEGLGGSWMIWTEGCELVEMERVREGAGPRLLETDGADDDVGDGDLVRLRSFVCRLDCGFTSLERKPGAILSPATEHSIAWPGDGQSNLRLHRTIVGSSPLQRCTKKFTMPSTEILDRNVRSLFRGISCP